MVHEHAEKRVEQIAFLRAGFRPSAVGERETEVVAADTAGSGDEDEDKQESVPSFSESDPEVRFRSGGGIGRITPPTYATMVAHDLPRISFHVSPDTISHVSPLSPLTQCFVSLA